MSTEAVGVREEIARIINPAAWPCDDQLTAYPDEDWEGAQNWALAKADAILALPRLATRAVEDEREEGIAKILADYRAYLDGVTPSDHKRIAWEAGHQTPDDDDFEYAQRILSIIPAADHVKAKQRVVDYIAELLLAVKPFAHAADAANAQNAASEPKGERCWPWQFVSPSDFAEAYQIWTADLGRADRHHRQPRPRHRGEGHRSRGASRLESVTTC